MLLLTLPACHPKTPEDVDDTGGEDPSAVLEGLPTAGCDAPSYSWLHPTMGFFDVCAQTALGIEGAAFPILFASMGFVVVAPDYLGMAGWGEPSPGVHAALWADRYAPHYAPEFTAIGSIAVSLSFRPPICSPWPSSAWKTPPRMSQTPSLRKTTLPSPRSLGPTSRRSARGLPN